jgi:creatinine amidohydrolase
VTTMSPSVHWAEMFPREFLARQQERSLVYLPLGLCEPHGHAAVFGLDTLKAEWICAQSARRFGGIVAPTQAYQIHETGYHKPWLREVIGDVNPHLAGVPPHVLLHMLVFQLRSFVNAGFREVAVVTGHHGNQADLRLVAREVMATRPVRIVTVSDPELVKGAFEGDHAGQYELSQLLYIRPELVDLERVDDVATSPLKRFAQGPDAASATAERGRQIMESSVVELERLLRDAEPLAEAIDPISLDEAEQIWQRVHARSGQWRTLSEEHPDLAPEEL